MTPASSYSHFPLPLATLLVPLLVGATCYLIYLLSKIQRFTVSNEKDLKQNPLLHITQNKLTSLILAR